MDLDLIGDTTFSPAAHNLPTVDRFREEMNRLGIQDIHTKIVLYDTLGMQCHNVFKCKHKHSHPNLDTYHINHNPSTTTPFTMISCPLQDYFHLHGHGSHLSLWAMTRTRSTDQIHCVLWHPSTYLDHHVSRLNCSGVCSGWRAACMEARWIQA